MFLAKGRDPLASYSDLNGTGAFNATSQMVTLTQLDHRRVKRAYYAAISFVDSLVGKIIDRLK